MIDIGSRIREFRDKIGLTRADFGHRMGEKASKIQDIEGGKQRINDIFLLKLVGSYPVSLDELFTESELEPLSPASQAPTPRIQSATFSTASTIPHLGMASCSVQGWGKAQPEPRDWPRPSDITDPDAFYVTARGQSMQPDGIPNGAHCVISPTQKPVVGDRIWIKEGSGSVAIKRLLEIGERSIKLRGWMPVQNGKQQSFDEERMTNYIKDMHPVVAVYKNTPGTDNAELIPDPKADNTPNQATARSAVLGEDQSHGLIKLFNAEVSTKNNLSVDDERALSSIAFPKDWLSRNRVSPEAASLVFARGSSMAPTITDGAVTLIDHKQRTPIKRQIYAYRQGDDLLVNRLEQLSPDTLLALSDNPEFETRLLTGNDLKQVEVIGKVIWVGASIN